MKLLFATALIQTLTTIKCFAPASIRKPRTALNAVFSKDEKQFQHSSALNYIGKELDESVELPEVDIDLLNHQQQDLEEFIHSQTFIEVLNDTHQLEQHGTQFISEPIEESHFSTVWQARILLLVAAALYGTNFTFVKVLNEQMPVEASTFLRFSLAAVATLPWLLSKQASQSGEECSLDILDVSKESCNYGALIGGLEVGAWNAFGYMFQAIGLLTTPASTSSFICSLAVVTVPILDFLTGKKILKNEIIGALFAVVGVALLELEGLSDGLPLNQGDIFSLVQPLAFGLGFWRMEHYLRKYPSDAMKLTAAQLFTIALSSLGVFLFTSHGNLPEMGQIQEWMSNPVIVKSLLWTGLITTALTVAMETIALKTLSAAETTMLFSTEPIFGGLCASYVLGEQFGLGGFIGSALVLGGCLYSNLGKEDTKMKKVDLSSIN